VKISIDSQIRNVPFYPKAMMYGLEDGWTRLSSNENPYPPSPGVLSAILDTLIHMNRYPGGELELKRAVSELYGLSPENVMIGNGSNELIEVALRAMTHRERRKIIIPEPSFAFYGIAAQIYGYEAVKVPLSHMKTDLKAISEAIDENTRLIFLCNPNNPTGTIIEEEPFLDFLHRLPPEILVLADEAYAEFSVSKKFPHSSKIINDLPVLIMRTFSKAYGLAGLRIGYGMGEAGIVSFLERTKQPFSVNMVALEGARAALADQEHLKKVLQNNEKGKKFLYSAFKRLSLEYVPTEANFVLLKVGDRAERISKTLFEDKILVRWLGAYNLPEYIRVTIGTMTENSLFIEALKRILKG
jgi:histidinol-phosphate aminotransferase